ncbi:MAG: hypothetical protein KC708_22575 [Anaerolineae bacterium]|nr:hypothetical protein [Anaerolineae bacterium]
MRRLIWLMLACWLMSASLVSFAQTDERLDEIPASYEMVAENDLFQLYVDSATLAFKVLDKRSGYVWHSGIDEVLEDDRLNRSWTAFALSGISIEYLDNRAVDTRTSITNTNATLDVTPIDQGIAALVTFDDYGITVGMHLLLEAEGVRVELLRDQIREDNPDFRLGRVYLYPFLGATRGSSTPGYMFIPDGVGSIIRYADTTQATNMFIGRYYGADLGFIGIMPFNEDVTNPIPISFPVLGAVHGEKQNAFISVVEDGAAYGEVQVHPAGIITNFNFLYNAFIYNQTYFQATNRSGAGVTTVQRETNHFDAVVHYRFLTGDDADVIGMARSYQQYLLDRDLLRDNEDDNPNIGIRLEFLGGDKEKVLLWDRFVPMTTVAQIRDILDRLQIPSPEVIYYGWQPYGATSMPSTSLSLEGGLGSVGDLNALAEDITSAGGHFSLYLEPQAAYWEESGYSARNDLAMAIINEAIRSYNRYYNYVFTLPVLQDRFRSLTADLAARLNGGLALDSIGFMLYSDFRRDTALSRQDAIAAYRDLLAESPVRIGMYRPNDYLFGLTQAYYDMQLGNNGYIFTSEPVPFLPTVLAGYVPYYGTALNFSSNMREDLLRQVEYGIYPSFFVTQEPTADMLNTRSSWIYTSSIEQWGEDIRSTYAWMNDLLAPVRGQQIVAHEQLASGVYMTTYDNGERIVVNYNDAPVEQYGSTIGAKDALLLESDLLESDQ